MADDQTPRRRECGTMQVHHRLLDTDPGYARRLARIEEHAFRARFSFAPMRPGCTLVPVVVHVVHKTAAQNISQAQIDSQIEVLNRDFRKTNPDVSSVPAPFAPLAGDARLQFELASIDPDGNPTDGVIRVETNKDSFGSDDQVKFSSSGGSDAWPRDEYLNIWVCQLSGGLLGYAQFPGGPAETDGVVITHTGFGTTGTAAAPFDKGRTATHEIGHWLNLRHIWGDDGSGCSGSDFIDDTPNQGGANTGKPAFPTISCNNGPNGDMFMNYMDYVDDDTMVMFTEGQVTRMHACLDGPRSSIGSSIPCAGPKPVKEGPKDLIADPGPKPVKEGPKDAIADPGPKPVKEGPKDLTADPGPKPFKEGPKDLMADPGPKPFKEGPKDLDPGPKQFFEPPTPKSFLEPPFGLPPIGPWPALPAQPFVIATGQPPQMQFQQLLAFFAQILGQYAGLHQRGLLDAQGLAAWQQAYATYRQLGGY